jgi:hypothetical protein
VRRFAITAFTMSLMLGLSLAQEPKKDEPKAEAKPADVPKTEAKPEVAKEKVSPGEAPKPPVELPLPTVPPEVEAKRQAALHAIADLIVAAQDAGLVETSIEPPPILDILVQGYAIDLRDLKATPKRGVSPEVFAAWWTGSGRRDMEPPVNYEADVRIIMPSKGLKKAFDTRADLLKTHIEMVRKEKIDAKAVGETKAKSEAEAKMKSEAEAKAKSEAEAKKKAEDEAKKKSEADAKAKADADAAKAKADAEAKAKADADAKAKAEAEAKAKSDADAKAKAEADKPKEDPKPADAPK